jgi:AcrR family transcriptional regulator
VSVPRARGGAAPVSAEVIRREAIRLFGERTYPVIGMRDLSEAVGILPGSLYAHITSKEALLMSIVEEGIGNYLNAIAPAAAGVGSADERLRAALRAHMTVLSRTREQTRVTFEQWGYLGADNRQRVLALRQEYLEVFMLILKDGMDEGLFRQLAHPRIAILSIIGSLNSATEWFVPDGPDSPDDIADALADNALHGLLA